MLRYQRSRTVSLARIRLAVPASICAVGTLLAACSADISRLDSPTYSANESAPRPVEPLGRRNAGAPSPYKNDGWSESGPRANNLPPLDPSISQATLPPPASQQKMAALPPPTAGTGVGPSRPFDAPKAEAVKSVAAAPQPAPAKPAIKPGATIEVQPGDTLYGLAKTHSVSIAAIMELNALKSPALRPGQKLVLPASARRPVIKAAALPQAPAQGSAPSATTAPVSTPAAAAVTPPQSASAPAGSWTGSHTVQAGELLYGIARKHKVKLAELQSVNAITEPLKVRPGVVLKVPGGTPDQTPTAPQIVAPVAAAPAVGAPAPAAPVATAPALTPTSPAVPGVKILNTQNAQPAAQPESKVAALNTPKLDTPAVSAPAAPVKASTAGTKFRWPVKGAVITNFGKRPDGSHNDGINISVPAGTEVMAAESGVIAYAGSELKGYGNLVLVRHDNGWVSAYAHADEVLVKRGESVKRGQVIAKAGKTGSVDQPQVHFELRQGSAPVDPLPHMEKN